MYNLAIHIPIFSQWLDTDQVWRALSKNTLLLEKIQNLKAKTLQNVRAFYPHVAQLFQVSEIIIWELAH